MAHSTHQEKAWVEPPLASDRNTLAKHDTATVPLREALLQLPQQYFRAVVKPSVATYVQDKGNASWGLVWIQLLAWAILDAALGVLVNLFSAPANDSVFSRFFAIATSYGLVIVVPALFFLLMGIVYWLAKYFGGQGTFLEQCNTSLYIQAPLGILSKLLALIPGVGKILNTILSLYGIVIQVVVIIAVHRLSRGKAIAAILLPLVTGGALAGIVFLLMRK
jgi:Yip1 domain